jgi:hypothetical protein
VQELHRQPPCQTPSPQGLRLAAFTTWPAEQFVATDATQKSAEQFVASEATHQSVDHFVAAGATHQSAECFVATDATHKSAEHFMASDAAHQSVDHLVATGATNQPAAHLTATDTNEKSEKHEVNEALRLNNMQNKQYMHYMQNMQNMQQYAELFTTTSNHSAALFVATVHTAESAAQVGTTDYINLSAATVHTPRSTVHFVTTDTNDQSEDNWGARNMTANLQADENQAAAVSQSDITASSDPAWHVLACTASLQGIQSVYQIVSSG